jgi:tRNA A37 methylthiotransferase MiaB
MAECFGLSLFEPFLVVLVAQVVAYELDLSERGFKEITLLGQNVNSYNDMSELGDGGELQEATIAEGFKTVC